MNNFTKTILVICVTGIILFAVISVSINERDNYMNAPIDNSSTEQQQQYNNSTPYFKQPYLISPEDMMKLQQQIDNLPKQLDQIPQKRYYSETPDDAYNIGFENGYEQGLSDGRNGYSHGYGYDDSSSYYNYYETRYQEGYEEGYNEGYALGTNEFEENQDDDDDDDNDDW